MKKQLEGFFILILVSLLIFFACKPKVTPVPSPTIAPATPASTPMSADPIRTSAEEAWVRVVETAKKERKVTIYSHNLRGDIAIAVSRSFRDKYGILAEIVSGQAASLVERIKTEKRMGQMTADAMEAVPIQIRNIKDVGATVSSEGIPVLQEKGVWQVEPWAPDRQKHILAHTLLNTTIAINTNLVKVGEEPKSYRELSQPKWKGKMVVIDPGIGSVAGSVFQTLLRRNFIDLETVSAIGRNGVTFVVNSEAMATRLLQGEFAIDLSGGQGTQYASFMGERLPVKGVALEEGIVISFLVIAATKDSPHPSAAKLFINWLLSKDGMTVLSKAEAMPSPRMDIPNFARKEFSYTPSRLIVLTEEDDKENASLFREKFLAKLWGSPSAR